MTTLNIVRRGLLAAATAALALPALGWAQYPDKPIKLIVPFAAGGGTDSIARDMARTLGERLKQPAVDGVEPWLFDELTSDPRRYGWHATLKPPFRPADGVTLEAIDAATEALARQWQTIPLPPLRVATLGQFLALRPQGPMEAVNPVAAACVQQLHALARPQSADELARRAHPSMTPRQHALLQRWAYPWVLDEFRFHCSLTGPLGALDDAQTVAVTDAARRLFDDLPPPVMDSIALFVEPAPGADFRLHRHWSLSA